jgi:hypothetical protein
MNISTQFSPQHLSKNKNKADLAVKILGGKGINSGSDRKYCFRDEHRRPPGG